MTRAEKRELIEQLIAENPERSDREIGRLAGVSPTTVGTLRRKLDTSKLDGPKLDASKLDTHKLDSAPRLDSLSLAAPKLDTQKLDASKLNGSELDAPKLDTRLSKLDGSETGRLVDLTNDPVDKIAAQVQTLTPERLALLAPLFVPGLGRRDRGPPRKYDRAAIFAAHAAGLSSHKIAERFGAPYSTITWILNGTAARPRFGASRWC
jgi:hypothetical protein